MDEITRRIEVLEGQLTATMAALRALIATHPQPSLAIRAVGTNLDVLAAVALASPSTDPFTEAVAAAHGRLLPSTELLRAAKVMERDMRVH